MSAAHDHIKKHLYHLVGERHPVSAPNRLHETEAYLSHEFSHADLTVATQPFAALGGTHRNVIATMQPVTQTQLAPPLIIGGHFDTVKGSPGADDNASALAVMLVVARQVRDMKLARPIHFIAFNLEEENLLGSLAYASLLQNSHHAIYGAIILECVGYASHQPNSQKIPPGVPIAVPTTGNFLAVIGNERSHALTGSVAKAMNPHLPIVPLVVPGNGEKLPDTRRSDHTSFWEHGFPAVMLTDTANFRNPHYHKPTDTLETLNLDFMASVAEGLIAAVTALASQQTA